MVMMAVLQYLIQLPALEVEAGEDMQTLVAPEVRAAAEELVLVIRQAELQPLPAKEMQVVQGVVILILIQAEVVVAPAQ